MLARQQVYFEFLGLTKSSARVSRWLKRHGHESLLDLSLREYEAFCLTLQKAWEKDQAEITRLRLQAEALFQPLALDWQHQIIQVFLHDEGFTPNNLKRLCEALQTEIHGDPL